MLAGSRRDDVPADHCERWAQEAKLVEGNADRIGAVGHHIGQPARLERAESIALADQARRIDGVKAGAIPRKQLGQGSPRV